MFTRNCKEFCQGPNNHDNSLLYPCMIKRVQSSNFGHVWALIFFVEQKFFKTRVIVLWYYYLTIFVSILDFICWTFLLVINSLINGYEYCFSERSSIKTGLEETSKCKISLPTHILVLSIRKTVTRNFTQSRHNFCKLGLISKLFKSVVTGLFTVYFDSPYIHYVHMICVLFCQAEGF